MAELVRFSKDGKFLENKVGVAIEVAVPEVSALTQTLVANSNFPPGQIKLGAMSAQLEGGSGSLRFGEARGGVVSFKGGAPAHSGVGVYDTAAKLRKDLDPESKFLEGLELPVEGLARFVALNWDYDIQGAVKGSLGLGAGTSIKFGADGQTDGFFAVIRAFPQEPRARDAIQGTLSSWMLPRQVESVDQLEPGTWLVAELDGEFSATLGAKFGYDFNWIRNVGLKGLTGDIGLRIQAAADATLGFGAGGKYLLVVARESTNPEVKTVRVRLSRMTKKGWNFALNAAASVKGSTGKFLPGELDDFIAAVFGLHGAQLVEDLKKFREWTNPDVPLPEVLAGFAASFVRRRLSTHAGDAPSRLGEARKRIKSFLQEWNNLPHKVSSLLWSRIRKGGDDFAEGLGRALRALASTEEEALRKEISGALSDVAFFNTPLGEWLEAAASGTLLTALGSSSELRRIRDIAQETLAILDGKVLEGLTEFAAERLNLDLVRKESDKAASDGLDPWLREKLSEFLGKKIDFKTLDEVRRTLNLLDEKSAELYRSGIEALNRNYTASLTYAFSSSTTRTALLDVSFDFAREPGLGDSLINAIHGNWNAILLQSRPGITLNQAVLTHGIRRQSHLELTLPYFKSTVDKMNQSLAKMSVVDDGGRLFVYELKARDEIIARRKWQSTMALTGKIVVKSGADVRTFAGEEELSESMTCSYNFRLATDRMRAAHLEALIEPLAELYFRRAFGGADAPDKGSLREWIADLDKHADAVENNGTGNLGNVSVALEVALPGRVVAAWHKAPGEQAPASEQLRYMEMSRSIQRSLRRIIPLCYFIDPKHYAGQEMKIAAQVLAYQALPLSTSISLSGKKLKLNTDKKLYWEYNDARPAEENERHAMLFNDGTRLKLRREMARVQALLADMDGLRSFAQDYDPDRVDVLLSLAFKESGKDLLTQGLLFAEAETIRQARDAAREIARFRDRAASDAEGALEALASFGEKVTRTFNSGLSDLFGGPTIRELGSLLFLEAARAFDPALETIEPLARLEVAILRSSAPQTWREEFLAGARTGQDSIALMQPVVSI